MQIGIDARLWNQTGVGRYIRNLISNLQDLDPINDYTIFVMEEDAGAVRKALRSSNFKLVATDVRWHSISEQTKLKKVLERENLDLMHFPYFSLPVFYSKPYVLTVHDLILNHFPTGKASTKNPLHYNLKRRAYLFIIKRSTKKARRIIAVSQATKHEIVDHLGVNKDRVSVIHEGVEESIISGGKKSKVDKPFILYVGNVYPHKNIERAVLAFLKAGKPRDAKFIFVGKDDFFYKNLKQRVEKMNPNGSIQFYEYVDDAKLSTLYKDASALIMPSLMEGFGLPVLEAMANGCLVICSDIPALREVAGEAGVYFNPKNIQDISEKIEFAFSSDSKASLISNGIQRSKDFSWRKMSEQTLRVYKGSI